MELRRAPVELAPFLRDGVRHHARQGRAEGLEFAFDAGSGLPAAVLVDERRLRQVLLNLLSNAVKFTEHGARHAARSCAARRRGTGAPAPGGGGHRRRASRPSSRSRCSEPFEQVGDTRQRRAARAWAWPSGAQLVQAMGGDDRVATASRAGCLFSVELPATCAAAPAAPAAAPRGTSPLPRAAAPRARGRRRAGQPRAAGRLPGPGRLRHRRGGRRRPALEHGGHVPSRTSW